MLFFVAVAVFERKKVFMNNTWSIKINLEINGSPVVPLVKQTILRSSGFGGCWFMRQI